MSKYIADMTEDWTSVQGNRQMGFTITLYLFELISFQQFHVQILYNGNIQRKNHFYICMHAWQRKNRNYGISVSRATCSWLCSNSVQMQKKQSAAKHSELRKQEILTAFKNLLRSCSRKRNQHQSTWNTKKSEKVAKLDNPLEEHLFFQAPSSACAYSPSTSLSLPLP